MLMRVLWHLLICTALRADIIVAEALYNNNNNNFLLFYAAVQASLRDFALGTTFL